MGNYPIKVLIVDDSAFMRKVIREMLERSSMVEVVGQARNGRDALEMTAALHPDVVAVDLFMPEMDGVEYIRAQMELAPLPVVVISSVEEEAELVQAALEAGAVEFVHKPTDRALNEMYTIQRDLMHAILAAGSVRMDKMPTANGVKKLPVSRKPESTRQVDAVLLGVSTGGPRALRALLPRFPADMPVPIAVTLHIPTGYTLPMAQRLNEVCALEVVESSSGMEMKPGRIILSRAGEHTRLVKLSDGMVVTVLKDDFEDSLYVPSVDELFQSGAEVYGRQLLGVVMTGMGNDGTKGAAWIKAQGGLVFAEAESSSIVYGMPRSVVEAGLADRVVALDNLAEAIMEVI
jgi:two-component system, chemotaxis family, protein-glutamate methylesterase/glutaminase